MCIRDREYVYHKSIISKPNLTYLDGQVWVLSWAFLGFGGGTDSKHVFCAETDFLEGSRDENKTPSSRKTLRIRI